MDGNESISDIKKQIQNEEGLPCNIQVLLYYNRQLDDKQKLSDYNIHSDSTLQLVLRTRGGGKGGAAFKTVDAPDVEANEMIKTGKNPYKYYFVKPGLNYGGICHHHTTKERVVHHRGFGTFSPQNDINLKKIKCPFEDCGKPFTLLYFFLYQCNVTIEYKKVDQEPKDISKKIQGNNIVWKLGGNENILSINATYEALSITCEKLNQDDEKE